MRKRVAVFEDDPLVAEFLSFAIEEAGHTMAGVYDSGHFAAAVASEVNPDVVIVDLNLRDGETGIEVARAFAERGCAVLIYSGHDRVGQAFAEIQHTFVPKPVTAGGLATVLAHST